MSTCTQPKCRIAETGVCLEGHKQGCPHLVPEAVKPSGESTEQPGTAATSPKDPEPFRFHTGNKLTISEASQIMNNVPVRLVLCAGAQWAGKTTFLARIGEMFRNGSFRDFRFAGSKTLCAFENVSWLATISSGAGRPDTVRSFRTEKDTFFHLRVLATEKSLSYENILISDLPGETFPTALASKDFCLEQRALVRADHLALFLDCKCLIDNAKRHSERDNAILFLSRVQQSRSSPKSLQVHVVFSRWDYLSLDTQRQAHETFCTSLETELRKNFENSFGALRFSRIAARPNGMAPTDSDIQSIFASWLEDLPVSPDSSSRHTQPKRDFCAFGLT